MPKKLRNRFLTLLTEKERKERRRISKSEIARAIGVANNTVDNWIRNDIAKIEASIVENLCAYFECDLCDLLYLEDIPDEAAAPPPDASA